MLQLYTIRALNTGVAEVSSTLYVHVHLITGKVQVTSPSDEGLK